MITKTVVAVFIKSNNQKIECVQMQSKRKSKKSKCYQATCDYKLFFSMNVLLNYYLIEFKLFHTIKLNF